MGLVQRSIGRRTGIAVACAIAVWAPASSGADELGPGTHDLRVRVGGAERSYLLHLPPEPRVGAPLPLVLAFHGGGGRASVFERDAGLDAVADRERFAVVYPDGSGRLGRRLLTWNAGACCGFAMRENVDDVAFARALVAEVSRLVPIDASRLYATGHSNGAMMAYRLAAEAPELLAAIAAVGGAMNLEAFDPSQPVPVLHVHSVDDPRALYAGGLGPPFPLTRQRVLHKAVETELARWIARNGCPEEPVVLEERREEATGFTAKHMHFAPCTSGADVELWRLTGAGHGWPGGDAVLPERVVGPDTKVIDAAEEAWRFFSRFERDRTASSPAAR